MELSPSPGFPIKKTLSWHALICLFFLILVSAPAIAQKGGGKGVKDLIVRACTEEIGNGLYQASFSYENPNKKEVTVGEEDSYVRSSRGKKSKGPKELRVPNLCIASFQSCFFSLFFRAISYHD